MNVHVRPLSAWNAWRAFGAVTVSVALLLSPLTPAQAGAASDSAGVGAIVGALAGSLTGPGKNRMENTLIGAGIGGTLGYIVGNDDNDRASYRSSGYRAQVYTPYRSSGSSYGHRMRHESRHTRRHHYHEPQVVVVPQTTWGAPPGYALVPVAPYARGSVYQEGYPQGTVYVYQ
jgi:hypothetical protein